MKGTGFRQMFFRSILSLLVHLELHVSIFRGFQSVISTVVPLAASPIILYFFKPLLLHTFNIHSSQICHLK